MEDPSFILGSKCIAYITDVEGHWDYFCSFVELCNGLNFHTPLNDQLDGITSEDLELDLKDDWHFVFGGDCSDKGPGTLRFQEAMVKLKKKYPDRVHLLLGNRDINKMALTSELDVSEIAVFKDIPAQIRSSGECRPSGSDFLRGIAATEEGIPSDLVTDAMINCRCTKANKLKYMFKHKMNSEGEFDYRRRELAIRRNADADQVTDDEVVASYERGFSVDGCAREYLQLAQVGVFIDGALFVHGQIIGNDFKYGKTHGADKDGVAWSIRVVPGVDGVVEDLTEWLAMLNAWARKQVNDWIERPIWHQGSRGGSELMEYASASSIVPTVIYCKWLTKLSMPKKYPPELVDYLKRQGVRYVIVGHTPHGSTPTIIQNDGVTVVMCDTSYSDVKQKHPTFPGDMRGKAVSNVFIAEGKCNVTGLTEAGETIQYRVSPDGGDPFVGQIQKGDPREKRFFVKARLPRVPGRLEESYIMCNVQKFKYEYANILASKMQANLAQLGVDAATTLDLSGCGRLGGFDEQLLEYIFQDLDRTGDGKVTKKQLAAACTNRIIHTALVTCFPEMSMDSIFKICDSDLDGLISSSDLLGAFGVRSISCHLKRNGIYFEVVSGESGEGQRAMELGEFPCSLGPFLTMPTVQIMPNDLRVDWGGETNHESILSAQGYDCEISVSAISKCTLKKFQGTVFEFVLHSRLSPISPVGLSDADRAAASIPTTAVSFAWCYPFLSDWEAVEPLTHPDEVFLTVGAYVYFDESFCVVQINSVFPEVSGGLQFGPPKRFSQDWVAELRCSDRWHPVTLRKLLLAGAREFCWLRPNEVVAGSYGTDSFTAGDFGAFAYVAKLGVSLSDFPS